MAGSKIAVPELSPEWMAAAFQLLEPHVRGIFADGYMAGYEQGERDAIARIMRAVQPSSEDERSAQSRLPGERKASPPGTGRGRELVDMALSEAGPKGMTAGEIFQSPHNSSFGITQSAIRKVLSRGGRQGRYVKKFSRWLLKNSGEAVGSPPH
jgi:hypothetical protein